MTYNGYALIMRLGSLYQESGLTANDVTCLLNAHGYTCPPGTWRRVINERKKVNRHLIETLAVVFDKPRQVLISDPGYESLPRCPDHDHSNMHSI